MKLPDKKVIEIADFLFANPQANRKDVLAYFGKTWQSMPISTRTFDRLLAKAKEYNKTRINKQEQAKEKGIVKAAEKQVERQAMTRYDAIRILETIAKSTARNVPSKFEIDKKTGEKVPVAFNVIYPNDSQRIAAIDRLKEMQGWDKETNLNNDDKEKTIIIKFSNERTIEI
jgi:hypothetical protein